MFGLGEGESKEIGWGLKREEGEGADVSSSREIIDDEKTVADDGFRFAFPEGDGPSSLPSSSRCLPRQSQEARHRQG